VFAWASTRQQWALDGWSMMRFGGWLLCDASRLVDDGGEGLAGEVRAERGKGRLGSCTSAISQDSGPLQQAH